MSARIPVSIKAPAKTENIDDSRLSLSLRNCMAHFATGVAIVSYETTEGPRGLTVNSFTSVSLDPPLVLFCIDKRSKGINVVLNSPFAVNMLHSAQQNVAMQFAGMQPIEAMCQWREVGQVPVLDDCLAWIVCEPWMNHDAGDHVIVVGRVAEFDANADRPLCFFRGKFLQLGSEC